MSLTLTVRSYFCVKAIRHEGV